MLVPVEKWIIHHTYFMLLLIVYVYLLYFTYRKVNIPGLIMQRQFRLVVLLMVVLIFITWAISQIPIPKDDFIESPRDWGIRQHIRSLSVWFFFFVVTGFSLAIELMFELFKQILSKQEIEAEKNKAELALYKAQINPHFLFNTLNTLYALVLSRSDKTESAFVKFSGILRYMYSQSGSELIPAERELDYIHQYVDLQQLRLNRHTQVELVLDVTDRQVLIPPMILITFVENAFKYGTSSDTDCIIRIHIRVDENNLRLETENAVMRRREGESQGIGIANCRKRLELLYPGRYDLQTGEADGRYRTFLNIWLR